MSDITDTARVLRELWEENRDVSPERVVEVATPTDHVLHDRFEWDDKVAGHEFRLTQARSLIRTVRIQRVEDEQPVRGYLHINRADVCVDDELSHLGHRSGVYVPADWVAERPALKAAVMTQMRQDWINFRSKYDAYQEFWELLANEALVTAS